MAIVIPTSEPLKYREYAWYLKEYDELVNGTLSRVQSISVVRNDKLVEFDRVLGPSSKFEGVSDIFIFGGFEETVDALMNYALVLREDTRLAELIDEQNDNSTLIQDYADSIEMKRHLGKTHRRTLANLKANRSTL
jgi:hypothetical protein